MTATTPEHSQPCQQPVTPVPDPLAVLPQATDASFRVALLVVAAGGALWLVISSVLGLIASIKFHSPVFLADSAWLTYGRVRAAAIAALMYGFCVPAGLATGAWIIARLGRSRLVAPPSFTFGVLFWNFGVAVALYGILSGDATGFELMEMPGYAAGLLFAAYLLLGVPAVLTLHRRVHRPLYVSQWYLLAALFWFPWIFSTAALLLPGSVLRGMTQAVVGWWFAGNLQFVWCSLAGLAVLFYFVPKLTNTELCSHNKALFGFWILILFGTWTGIPITAPVPAWIPTLSASMTWVFSLVLVVVALIFYSTMDGKAGRLWGTANLKFFGFALLSFLLAGLMNLADTIPAISRFTSFTWFVAAEMHLQVYGFFAMALFGALYVLLPEVTGAAWPWPRMVSLHFWLAAIGTILIALPWIIGGIIQGSQLQNPDFAFVEIARRSLMYLRVSTIGDLLLVIGHLLLLLNVLALISSVGKTRFRSFATQFATEVPPAEVKS